MSDLHEEIVKFQSFFKSQKQNNVGQGILHEVGPLIFKFTPKNLNKTTKLGLIGLTHGNEMIGLPILNSLLEQITSGYLHTNFEIFFALGNLPAALENKRFLSNDLNRCFGVKNNSLSGEMERARQLEKLMLDHCDFIVDFHQTINPTKSPFVIFQYSSPKCIQLMKLFDPGIPVILQLESIGSSGGLSTDEYVRKNGGFGFAVELGQKTQIENVRQENFDLGMSIALNVIDAINKSDFAEDKISETNGQANSLANSLPFPLFVMGASYKVSNMETKLNPGLENFQKLLKGQILGQSKLEHILVDEDCFLLFPKYSLPILPGQELFYTCKRFLPEQLPQLAHSSIQIS